MAHFFELEQLEKLCDRFGPWADVKKLGEVYTQKNRFPIYSLTIGNPDPAAPTLGLFAGVHGLEKIGTHVLLNYLGVLAENLQWDEALQQTCKEIRIASIPIVNPGGMYLNWRSNPNGVDIMRNAPVEIVDGVKPQFMSGHRISPFLPWYRGISDGKMEVETTALVDFVAEKLLPAKFSLSLDLHSGFGMVDRLWFPYSKTKEPFPHLPVADKIKDLLDKNVPQHIYRVEPQSASYLIHGDPWDLLYDRQVSKQNIYIPYTLEMGSWMWVRKNPRQLFSSLGLFNPVKLHRYNRIMRRHRPLFEFLMKIVANHSQWPEN